MLYAVGHYTRIGLLKSAGPESRNLPLPSFFRYIFEGKKSSSDKSLSFLDLLRETSPLKERYILVTLSSKVHFFQSLFIYVITLVIMLDSVWVIRRCEAASFCSVFIYVITLDSWCPWAYNLSSLCSDIRARAFTMSPEQSQYILHKTKTYPFVRIGWSSLTLGPPKVVQSFLGLTSTQSKRNG